MVDSPNIVKLLDIVEAKGHTYIVTEILEGGTLREWLNKKGQLDEM
jgi:serine/threonine protein kinase